MNRLSLGLHDVMMSAPLSCQQHSAVACAWHWLCNHQILKVTDVKSVIAVQDGGWVVNVEANTPGVSPGCPHSREWLLCCCIMAVPPLEQLPCSRSHPYKLPPCSCSCSNQRAGC